MLLRFSARNHRSIREPIELSLVSTSLHTLVPRDGDWRSATVRVAGIYGPNASGKSNILSALNFAQRAVRESATQWSGRSSFPHHPFRLSVAALDETSEYEFDFVLNGERHLYGFESSKRRIEKEWLISFGAGRPKKLFERVAERSVPFSFGRTLNGHNKVLAAATRENVLFLSSAANNNHEYLAQVFDYLTNHIRYAKFSESDQTRRLSWTRNILEQPRMLSQAQSLLRFADFGISEIVLHEEDANPEEDAAIVELFDTIQKTLDKTSKTPKGKKGEPKIRIELDQARIDQFRKSIRFRHGLSDQPGLFAQIDESSGTLAWLSLAVPALHALANGGTLLIDELDASLHPRLSSAIVSMFKDDVLNARGAQLIFTSHDATLLGQFSHSPLEREEIWFCEKRDDGSTDLFSLAEFSTRKEDNFEKRYLQGRYGAVPMISSSDLRDALAIGETPDQSPIEVVYDDAW